MGVWVIGIVTGGGPVSYTIGDLDTLVGPYLSSLRIDMTASNLEFKRSSKAPSLSSRIFKSF